MMKKLIAVTLSIFLLFSLYVITVGLFFNNESSNLPVAEPDNTSGSNSSSTNPGPKSNAGITLNLNEIAKHNTQTDCWLLIDNKIYSVASYLNAHPGGRNTIISYCGKEASAAFKGLPHSQNAHSLLASYYIGDLGQQSQSSTQNPGSNATPINVKPQQTPVSTSTTNASSTKLSLTQAEIAKHNTQTDCWLLIDNKIYSVASYLNAHPGGRNTIISYCGKEASAAFKGLPHSQNAHSLLASYYIGDLGQQVSQQAAQNPTTTVPQIGTGSSGEYEEEDEDD